MCSQNKILAGFSSLKWSLRKENGLRNVQWRFIIMEPVWDLSKHQSPSRLCCLIGPYLGPVISNSLNIHHLHSLKGALMPWKVFVKGNGGVFVNGISQLRSAMHMLVITLPPTIVRGWRTRALQTLPCYKSPTNDSATVSGRAMFVFHLQSAEVGLPVLMRELTPGSFFMQGGMKNSTRHLHDNRDCFVCPLSLVLGTVSFL